ncbi:MAG TPA: amidohydrolase family protein [Acidimicrobiales bacterium]
MSNQQISDHKVCLASADGHVGPPTGVYRDYLPKRLHGMFDQFYEHHLYRWAPQSESSFFPAEKNSKFWGTEGFDPEHGTAVTWDPNLRLKAMDQSMVACELLLPDDQSMNDPPWGSGLANAAVEGAGGSAKYPPELVRAGARAYNRWLAEFCSTDPARLRGATILGTLDDVVWATDEIERAYDEGLTTGIMLPLEYNMPLYHHPRYDPLWELCCDLDLPVVVHIGRGYPDYLGEDPKVQWMIYNADGMGGQYHLRPTRCFIMGGVFERFPKLRHVMTEAGLEWVTPFLAGLEHIFDWWPDMQASRDVPRRVDFTKRPTDYWNDHCFVTHSINQRTDEFEGDGFAAIPNAIWGADLGHDEGWWPVYGFPDPVPEGQPPFFQLPVIPVEDAYRTIFGGLEADRMLPYLESNFFRAYPNVDRSALDQVVQRIAPTVSELRLV